MHRWHSHPYRTYIETQIETHRRRQYGGRPLSGHACMCACVCMLLLAEHSTTLWFFPFFEAARWISGITKYVNFSYSWQFGSFGWKKLLVARCFRYCGRCECVCEKTKSDTRIKSIKSDILSSVCCNRKNCRDLHKPHRGIVNCRSILFCYILWWIRCNAFNVLNDGYQINNDF